MATTKVEAEELPEMDLPEAEVTVLDALRSVMADVGAIRKGDRNTQQNFNFRGIDAVVNAVYPALVRHGVMVVPNVTSVVYENVEVGQKRTAMVSCRARVTYTFYGPQGDSVSATVVAEAMDSGDKATPKAMSVAMRTALLQTLCLPTDEPDPDSQTYERAAPPTEEEVANRLLAAARTLNTEVEELTAKFRRTRGDLDMAGFAALPLEQRAQFVSDVERFIANRSN